MPRAQFQRQAGEKNKEALKAIVDSGEAPGLLAYAEDDPIAWCSVAPREHFAGLERSRSLKRVDDAPVWSVVCFFVAKPFRSRGVMVPLLTAAVEYARARGAKIVEVYPVEPTERLTGDRGYTGVVSAFRKAGFVEVLRRGTRPIMRCYGEEDLEDSLEVLRSKAEGENTRPLEEYLRERGAKHPAP